MNMSADILKIYQNSHKPISCILMPLQYPSCPTSWYTYRVPVLPLLISLKMNTGSLAPKLGASDAISSMLTTYNDLNSSNIDELTSTPSPLEFMRFVSRNRPFIVRGGASNWTATKTWNIARLKELMGDTAVEVAVTPKGYVSHTPISYTRIEDIARHKSL